MVHRVVILRGDRPQLPDEGTFREQGANDKGNAYSPDNAAEKYEGNPRYETGQIEQIDYPGEWNYL